jgi:hypothetical protein
MSRPIRLGEILIEQGVLNEQQVFEIVDAQRRLQLPFGVLAERLFEVTLASIERAWAEQYQRFTGTLDLDQCEIDTSALSVIGRRQAWQFELLPMGFEKTGELLIAASQRRLPRSVSYVAQRVPYPAFFRIAEPEQLRSYLQKHYPMPEVSQAMLEKARHMRLAS